MAISIPKRSMVVVLLLLFVLAFVISPYWSLLPSSVSAIAVLLTTLGIGLVWSLAAAADFEIRVETRIWLVFSLVLIGMLALNYRALTSVIPWRGDESLHIVQTKELLNRVPDCFVLLTPFAVVLAGMAAARRFPWLIACSTVLIVAAGVWLFLRQPFHGVDAWFLLRYPYLNYWLYAYTPSAARILWDTNHEFLFRLVSLLASAALVSNISRELSKGSWLEGLLWGIATATIPLVFYYSSILYLELPAVVLMLVVCLDAAAVLRVDIQQLMQRPAWYALILMGFIKETTLIFVICFLLCRAIFHWPGAIRENKNNKGSLAIRLRQDLRIAFCVLCPCVLYIVLRTSLIATRSYMPTFSNLLAPALYAVTVRAYAEQFGAFLPYAMGGIIVLFWRRNFPTALFLTSIILGVPLIFGIDMLEYAGYSRFNLLVLPAILTAAAVFVHEAVKWRRIAGAGLACIAIAASVTASPVYKDGTKVPLWGNYLTDTSEHYYPYDQALLWLSKNQPNEKILFSGLDYSYYFGFYFSKYDWHPVNETRLISPGADQSSALKNVLTEAGQGGFNLVLWQMLGREIPQFDPAQGYCVLKSFQNEAHALLLFSRLGKCPISMLPTS